MDLGMSICTRTLRTRTPRTRRRLLAALLVAAPLLLPSAEAEGTDQLNTTQALRLGTQLYVDIVAPGTESIRWTGAGTVQVTAPDGTPIAVLLPGQTASTAGHPAGAFGVYVNQGQVVSIRWDVEVVGATAPGGRLHAYDWRFDAGAFSSDRATYASFYAVVPGGGGADTAVIELQLDGLAGYVYDINANRVGVDGPDGGRSVPMFGHTVTPEFPIYLQPPTNASYTSIAPIAYGLDFVGGVSVDVHGSPITPCQQIVPGQSFGRFQFNTNVEGTFHLECDLDGDGLFESTGDDDFLAVGTTTPGLNTVLWDGTHLGEPVATGDIDCRVRINTGEFHYVGADIETSYEGLRLYEVVGDLSRRPLAMRWNDLAVQGGARTMANGELGLATSGELGVDPGPYGAPALANVNARSWGDHTSGGKGNQNYLDTYVWLASDTSATVFVQAVDASVDTDGDGLGDFEESCFYGTEPTNADTDGDGTPDGEQYGGGASSADVGGLESNGRLASALARRAITRSRVSLPGGPAAVGRVGQRLTGPGIAALREALDAVQVRGFTRRDATPHDLPSLTNAQDVYAFDLLDGDRVEGSVLVVETLGETYEHSKALCDRAGGATLVDIGATGGLLQSTFRHADEHTLDQAIEWKLYQESDGRWRAVSRWLRAHYEPPRADQRVLNVQVWGRHAGLAAELAQRILEGLGDHRAAAPSATALDEETHTTWTRAPAPDPSARPPAVAVTEGELLGPSLRLRLERLAGTAGRLQLRIDRVAPNGEVAEAMTLEVPSFARTHEVSVTVGPVRDLTVDVLVDGALHDRLWLSDGAWAAFDDGLWGGGTLSEVSLACTPRMPAAAEGLTLSGCARAHAARVDRFVGVARHIPRGVSGDWTHLRFWYRSDARVEACVEDTREGARHCRSLPAASAGAWGALDLAPLQGAPVRLVTVTRASAGSVEVSGPTFEQHELVDGGGCAAGGGFAAAGTDGRSGTGLFGLVFVLLVYRKASS